MARPVRGLAERIRGGPGPRTLTNRGVKLAQVCQSTGNLSALSDAVALFRAALSATPDGHPFRAARLNNLAGALQMQAELTEDDTLMAEAAEVTRQAVAALPAGHRARGAALASLSLVLLTLSGREKGTAVFEEAAQAARDAVALAPAGHPGRAARMSNLATIVRELYGRTGQEALLMEAAQANRDALAACRDGDPDRVSYLANLSGTLLAYYRRTGDPAALAELLPAARDAVCAAPDTHPGRGGALNNLGLACRAQFEHTVDVAVLTEAVQAAGDAAAAAGNRFERAMYLNNLSLAWQATAERSGETGALNEAVRAARDAVAAVPEHDLDRAAYLSNLSAALRMSAERTGDAATLSEAVQAAQDAAAAIPGDHPERGAYLHNLSTVLLLKFEHTTDSAALAVAARAAVDSVAAIPGGHPGLARRLSNLSLVLLAVSKRTEDSIALTEAVQAARNAVAASPEDDPQRPVRLASLSIALQTLSDRTRDVALGTEGAQAARDALAATPTDHPARAAHLTNLSIALQRLSRHHSDPAMLAEAIQAGRDAVAAESADQGDRAGVLINLGNALEMLSGRTGEIPVLAEAMTCFLRAAQNTGAPTATRVGAYRSVARLSGRAGGSPTEALDAMQTAVSLLLRLTPRVLARADREHSLRRLSLLAGEAAAAAVNAGSPDQAVALLEQARGVLIADALNARGSDLRRLRELRPDLADQFSALRARIEALDYAADLRAADTTAGIADPPRARQDAHAAWDHLLAQIRAAGGLEDFLRPPSADELVRQAVYGPIVLVYASQVRCDALILGDEPAAPVRLVPLAELTETDADRQIDRLLRALEADRDPAASRASRRAAQIEILAVLGWMWDTIAEPVLGSLGYASEPAHGQPWPRVWWCPVGTLALLPLHAAGHHADRKADPGDRTRTVLDLVVSSYASTIRSLAYARAQRPDPAADTTLIVAVPDAPGTPRLPGVDEEVGVLASTVPRARVLRQPRREAVLMALRSHPLVHFACHGYADLDQPRASQLILEDAPLTVSDISAQLLSGRLAYLSACDSTVTAPALANESLHITGAFQLAGYQHVIGTLWPVNDAAACRLALDFYRQLTGDGSTVPDANQAALALHRAVRRLRSRYPAHPSVWASHIHTGA